jgi:hypothetical protein
MLVGVAVSCAVGAGPLFIAGAVAPVEEVFFLQPANPATATSKTRQVMMRFLEVNSLLLFF